MNFTGLSIPNTGGVKTSNFVVDAAGAFHIGYVANNKVLYTRFASPLLAPSAAEVLSEEPQGMTAVVMATRAEAAAAASPVGSATNEAQRPALRLGSDGRVYMAYADPAYFAGKMVRLKSRNAQGVWTKAVTVGAGWQVDMVVDSRNQVHVVYGSNGNLYYRRFLHTLQPVAQEVLLTNSGHSPSLAIAPNGTVFVAWETKPASGPRRVEGCLVNSLGTVGSIQVLSRVPQGAAGAVDVELAPDMQPAYVWAQYETASSPSQVVYLHNNQLTVLSDMDSTCQNPRLAFYGETPLVTYHRINRLTRVREVRFGGPGVHLNVDNGWFPSLQVVGKEVYILYRHAPLSIELRLRHAALEV